MAVAGPPSPRPTAPVGHSRFKGVHAAVEHFWGAMKRHCPTPGSHPRDPPDLHQLQQKSQFLGPEAIESKRVGPK